MDIALRAIQNPQSRSVALNVRRGFLYEDAFEKLSPENEQNMKLRMRVQMQNAVGTLALRVSFK